MRKTYRDTKNQEKELEYFPTYVNEKVKAIKDCIYHLLVDSNEEHAECSCFTHQHFQNAIQRSVELYNAVRNMARQLSPQMDNYLGQITATKPKIEQTGNITRIVYDKLLPALLPDCYLHETDTIRDAYCEPIFELNQEMLKKGQNIEYSRKVVICFTHHLMDGFYPMGHHAYAIKQIIDCLALCFLRDDAPDFVALYTQEIIGGAQNYSEISIIPQEEFAEFAGKFERVAFDSCINDSIRDRKSMVSELAEEVKTLTALSILPSAKEFLASANRADSKAACECLLEIIKCSAFLVELIKTVMHQFGVKFITSDSHFERPEAKVETMEGGVKIRFAERMFHRKKGNTCNLQIAFPYLYVEELDEAIHGMDQPGLTYVVCFLQHYGPGSRLVDHDNIETFPYYDLATRYLPEHKQNACKVYMDSVRDANGTYSELLIMTDDVFLKWVRLLHE